MADLMAFSPPDPDNQVTLENWRSPPFNKWAFSNVRNLIPNQNISASNNPVKFSKNWIDLSEILVEDRRQKATTLQDFLLKTHTDSLVVLRDGALIWSWYGGYARPNTQHIIFSISKSLTALIALSLSDDNVLDLDREIGHYISEVKGSAYETATCRNLLDMNVSSNFEENYLDKTGIFHRYRNATGWNPCEPKDRKGLWKFLPSIVKGSSNHGDFIHYCSPHTDMMGWLIERVSNINFCELIHRKVFDPCGMKFDSYVTLDSFGAPRTAGGINICAVDLAKVGELMRCDGAYNGSQILSPDSVNDIRSYNNGVSWSSDNFEWAHRSFPSGRYRSNWYQSGQADGEFFGSGIHGQWLWINPKKRITIVRLASTPNPLSLADKDNAQAIFTVITDVLSV